MKSCAVKSCRNDSLKRPDLTFFNLPKDSVLKEEWLEILGIKRRENQNVAVCENHFKEKDFRAGKKKELKSHVVPIPNLGKGDLIDSDDDFMDFSPDVIPEMFQVTAEVHAVQSQHDLKQESLEEQIDQNTSIDQSGRRPSRKAAQIAAKKIYNTARNIPVSNNPEGFEANSSPKSVSSISKSKSKKGPPIYVDLEMDCCDDELSPIQAALDNHELAHYNMVVRHLKELVAADVKVMEVDLDGLLIPPSESIIFKDFIFPPNANLHKGKQVISDPTIIVPVTLSG
ncbi:THAP-type domain-containing protein [Caerostris extrusa]|uniref:THAP-type domain-containing protein n=1 Tax=Caerostris extrusa TaxID=172846 RepID=A0AAV4RDQ3_CAEEX|nr:THAP-type domain-containing protein [Caerostris extrusa]